ncbi:MAG TPA: GNAT family N-acetyltransferase [Terriglobales bacterium]|nr:GNAT family N-acetyltransferase [Terriglobales bacterium]
MTVAGTGTDLCSYLPWDSEFFKKRIARVTRTKLNESEVRELLAWCEENQIDCLYWLADDTETALARQHGFKEVDVRMTFEREVNAEDRDFHEPEGCCIRPASGQDLDRLREMARVLHHDTRFYFDKNFDRAQCDLLYETWIEKSCQGWAQAVFVAEANGELAGYVSCHIGGEKAQGNETMIGLLGVAEAHSGKGLGSALVRKFLAWSAELGSRRATVVTQGRNLAAQRLYQRCGFQPFSSQIWFHRWFTRP